MTMDPRPDGFQPDLGPVPCRPALNDVIADYLDAEDIGRPPDRQRLLADHPHLAGELAQFFANYDRLESLLGPLRVATAGTDCQPNNVHGVTFPLPGSFLPTVPHGG